MCQAHSLVQFKSERVPSRKGATALPCWEGMVPTSCLLEEVENVDAVALAPRTHKSS